MGTRVKTQVAKMKSPSWSRQRGGGKERNRQKERGREFEHVWKNSFIFTPESLARPSMPIHFLELAIVSPSGTIHAHSHTHACLACFSPLWMHCNLTPTWRQSQTHTHSVCWDDSKEMGSSSWGGPYAPPQKLKHPRGFPSPYLNTLILHVHLCRCVVCVLTNVFVWKGNLDSSPLQHNEVTVILTSVCVWGGGGGYPEKKNSIGKLGVVEQNTEECHAQPGVVCMYTPAATGII